MSIIESPKIKASYPKVIGKKELLSFMDKRLHTDLCGQSIHHNGVLNVACRLANFVGDIIPYGKTTFLEKALSQAMADWHAEFINADIQAAYTAYCLSLFKQIPTVLNYTVTGLNNCKPRVNCSWDCTSMGIIEWMHMNRIAPSELVIAKHSENWTIDPRDASFLLCSRIFLRQDLKLLGVIDEIHVQET